MRTRILFAIAILSAGAATAARTYTVTVDAAHALGPVKPMNAVNNGPALVNPLGDQVRSNLRAYAAARFPFARISDAVNASPGGAHACDMSALFPDFDADENDPKNYDFVFTDHYLDALRRTGTRIFFRLGETIEHGARKYRVFPPKDFAKWARIAEHVIRHYTEGWGWASDTAFTTQNVPWTGPYDIAYVEIWNEPDLDVDRPQPVKNPRCWGGTEQQFFDLYAVTARHLKEKFPSVRVGGPAVCGREDWCERFLRHCQTGRVPLDFFSWHTYARDPKPIAEKARRMRQYLDMYGFAKTESILDEWNYIRGWTDDFVYSLEVESGRFNQKAAAFAAATMCALQKTPVDMLMYYDAMPGVAMNGLFDALTYRPQKAYYAFAAWSTLADLGTSVAVRVAPGRRDADDAATGLDLGGALAVGPDAIWTAAAVGADGSAALLVARYGEDDNRSDVADVFVRLPPGARKIRTAVTDAARTHTQTHPTRAGADTVVVGLAGNAFALIEWERP